MPFINAENRREHLFDRSDEIEFKRQFVIQFLASQDAVEYQNNCHRGWSYHRPSVEDAHYLARKAWDEWVLTIGLAKSLEELTGA